MKSTSLLLALALMPLYAQDAAPPRNAPAALPPPPSEEWVTKLVHVQNSDPNKIRYLLELVPNLSVHADQDLRVLVLNGRPPALARAEQLIHEIDSSDSPRSLNKDLELQVSLLAASNTPLTAAPSDPPPQSLASVLRQLKGFFPYQNYALLSTAMLRTAQHAPAETKGVLANLVAPADTRPINYSIDIQSADLSPNATPARVHIERFRFNMQAFGFPDLSNTSNLDLRENQQVVVGNTNIGNRGIALFIVLTAHSLD